MKHDGCPSKNEIGIFKGKKNQGFFFFFLICGLETISQVTKKQVIELANFITTLSNKIKSNCL